MIVSGHSFSDGEFIKSCILEAVETLSAAEVQKYEKICLSRRTVARRVNVMAKDSEMQLKQKISKFISISLALDESTDICDTAQLAVFIRGVDFDFTITEELLDLIPMKGRTTGEDIFNAVIEFASKNELNWSNVHSVATDGAKSMTGLKNGFIGRLKHKFASNGYNDLVAVHCLIHQEALCAKAVPFKNVMDVVVNCIKIIRSQGLNHRQFKEFLEFTGSHHSDIPYFSEIRWLSRGATLKRFFELKTSISDFLVTNKILCDKYVTIFFIFY